MPAARRFPWLFLAILAFGAVADLVSKSIVFRVLPHEWDSQTVWAPFFYLKNQRNTGGVWGIGNGANGIFLILSIVAILAIVIYLSVAAFRGQRLPLPLAGILAGAFGNLWDRIQFGFVRDFLSVRIGSFHWPTFNVADSLICIGCAVMALGLLCAPEPEEGLAPKAAEGDAPPSPPTSAPAPDPAPQPPGAP